MLSVMCINNYCSWLQFVAICVGSYMTAIILYQTWIDLEMQREQYQSGGGIIKQQCIKGLRLEFLQNENINVDPENMQETYEILQAEMISFIDKIKLCLKNENKAEITAENSLQKVIGDVRKELKDHMEGTVTTAEEIKSLTKMWFNNVSEDLQYSRNVCSRGIKQLKESLGNLTIDTRTNVSKMHNFMQQMKTNVENFRKRIQDVDKKLLLTRYNFERIDEILQELQQLVETESGPNMFHAGASISVFLVVLTFVVILVCYMRSLKTTFQTSRSEIALIRKEFKTFKSEQIHQLVQNEVDGKRKK